MSHGTFADVKSSSVQIRLTARDLKRVEALAGSDQVTVSDFVRRLIRHELGEDWTTGKAFPPRCR